MKIMCIRSNENIKDASKCFNPGAIVKVIPCKDYPGDLEICEPKRNIPDYIVGDNGRGGYMVYGLDSDFIKADIRKKMVRAFTLYGRKHWKMSKRDAKSVARVLTGNYFNRDGDFCEDLLVYFPDGDFSGDSIYDFVCTEVSYW